jgi:hypothetical protein
MIRGLMLLTVAFTPAAMDMAAAQGPTSYAGQHAREIKALSTEEQADLLAGRGMGQARAGELNHYPGPAHVLELRDKLRLTPQQVQAVQVSFERMSTAAQPLGAELIERERAFDTEFRLGTVTPEAIAKQTATIAELQGRLRAVHLAAHIEMRAVLTPEQVSAYDVLRGYVGATPAEPRRQHGTHRG